MVSCDSRKFDSWAEHDHDSWAEHDPNYKALLFVVTMTKNHNRLLSSFLLLQFEVQTNNFESPTLMSLKANILSNKDYKIILNPFSKKKEYKIKREVRPRSKRRGYVYMGTCTMML